MTTDKWTKVLKPGDMTENPAGTMHQVKTGPEGVLETCIAKHKM
jgi:hypothetical protein